MHKETSLIQLQELKAENIEITDLCTLLGATVEQFQLRYNIVCKLLGRLADRVSKHLTYEDHSVYRGGEERIYPHVKQGFVCQATRF